MIYGGEVYPINLHYSIEGRVLCDLPSFKWVGFYLFTHPIKPSRLGGLFFLPKPAYKMNDLITSVDLVIDVFDHEVDVVEMKMPDEYFIAFSFFSEEPSKWINEIQQLYDFLSGRWDDWNTIYHILERSNFGSIHHILEYAPTFPSAIDLRDAITQFARENATAEMLLQTPIRLGI